MITYVITFLACMIAAPIPGQVAPDPVCLEVGSLDIVPENMREHVDYCMVKIESPDGSATYYTMDCEYE